MVARLQHWREYISFSRKILEVARQLHRRAHFDVIHHVTIASFRVPSPLWKLGVPFVFGPIGGYERVPIRLMPMLSPSAAVFELCRTGLNVASKHVPSIGSCIRNSAHVFAANEETRALVLGLGALPSRVSLLSAGFQTAERSAILGRDNAVKQIAGPLRVFAGGSLLGRKGIALALDALAEAKQRGVDFHYHVAGDGPEATRLKRHAAELGLGKEVVICDWLSGTEYYETLAQSDVFLLPSLGDSSGLTLMEAMLAECVPLVVDRGGPGYIVTPECGWKVPATSGRSIVRLLADALVTLYGDRSLVREKGKAAARRIVRDFSDENYRTIVNSTYQAVVQ